MFALASNVIPDLLPQGASQCFPFYTYAQDGSGRQENVTDWALSQFQTRYGAGVTKLDIFHYVYAMLHHPQYRVLYAENLKRELPRIPLAPKRKAFATCVRIGAELTKLHVGYEQVQEYPLEWKETAGSRPNWHVEKMRLSRDRTELVVNEWLTLRGFPPACFEYRLGNRSAVEWVIEQYQISTDARSHITLNPNRDNDTDYIPRLVARVVTVSMETVRLVCELADSVRLPTDEQGVEETAVRAASTPQS